MLVVLGIFVALLIGWLIWTANDFIVSDEKAVVGILLVIVVLGFSVILN